MAFLLDILGSSTIAAAIIFMVMQFNTRVNDSSGEFLFSSLTQSEAITGAEVIQYDFYKMGFGVSSETIKSADSANIKFVADLDNNSTLDSIIYKLGNTSELANTSNYFDRPLYRIVNGKSNMLLSVTSFNLSYFDSTGTEINSAQLINKSARDQVKTISIYLRSESSEPIDSIYQGIDWFRTIRPRNL